MAMLNNQRVIQLVAGCLCPTLPICSMYGIFTNICPKNHPNVGKYTIHGTYGLGGTMVSQFFYALGTPPETRAKVQDGAVLVAERREGVVEVWGFSSV